MLTSLLLYYCLFTIFVCPASGHIPGYMSTPANRVDQYCELSDSCVHDTIPICGKNGDEKRAFLDTCDLLEYACDTGQIYIHVEDTPGCP